MRLLPLLLSLLPFCACPVTSLAQREMPIVAYMGVPKTETSVQRYREMQECGFNTNIAMFDNESQLVQALQVADSLGLSLIPYCNAFFSRPESSVPQVESYASLMAYLVCDEPYVKDLPRVSERIAAIKAAGAMRPCYVNLHPYYSDKAVKQIGSSSYTEYLRACSAALDVDFLSFDHYPILHGDSLRSTWYDNLQMVRDEAKRTGRPFWAFVLCTPHLVYTEPTLAQLRLQVNVNLAYGAQAIQYYTYWHISDPQIDYHDSPIDSAGMRTPTYQLVRQVNEELRHVASLFYGGKTSHLSHVSRSYAHTKLNAPNGALGAILAASDGKRYVVLVNKSLLSEMTVSYRGETYLVSPGAMLMLPA
ncbi:MAG: beta-galactosidase [Prevotellaceae bacterium]|nr:beta-galactosidase [Prevotellaceae bacterium]